MKKPACVLLLLCLLFAAFCVSCGSDAASSRISAGESSANLRSCVAILREGAGDRIVEVVFFADSISVEEADSVASPSFNREINGKPAIFKIIFGLRSGATAFDFASLTRYGVLFYDSSAFPVSSTTGWAQVSFVTTTWEPGTFGISGLAGNLAPGESVRARVAWEDECTDSLAEGVGSLLLKWEIEIDCPLRAQT